MSNMMGDFIDIGSECFADGEALVISYKGANYYKACGAVVHTPHDNATHTTCVKRVDHPSKQHEDYYGNVREVVVVDDEENSEKPSLTMIPGG